MINLVYIDNHPISRKGFKSIFKKSKEIKLIGSYKSFSDAEITIRNVNVDVLVLGFDLISNHNLITKIIKLNYNTLLFGEYSNSEKIYFVNLGVKGFLSKKANVKEIRNAIYKLSKSEFYISDEKKYSIDNFRNRTVKRILSKREQEVLSLLFKGDKNIIIADKLKINPKTVNTYKTRALKKLRVKEIINAYSILKD
ncbi:MAG: response regulator transcription factor [Flavobacteriaceae bacterium]|nr:response regulator transcription factor [Flavobacteriaceae bacterium]